MLTFLYANVLSNIIRVERGTQGRHSSTYLFNIFYLDLMIKPSNTIGAICIDTPSCKVYSYADVVVSTMWLTSVNALILFYTDPYVADLSMKVSKTGF